MPEVCVVHLVRARNGVGPFRRFLESYDRCPGGLAHDLLLVFKGFEGAAELAGYDALLDTRRHERLLVPDVGFDIGPYLHAARAFGHRYFCFLNSFSVLLDADWLAKLARQAAAPGVGVAGATGSWESRGRTTLFEERLMRAKPLPNRVVGAARRAWRNAVTPGFPNYHVRTNGFLIRRDHLLALRCPAIRTKTDAHRFESGRAGLTRQILRRGLEPLVVGRDGRGYRKEEWPQSETFRQGGQHNLLIADNQTQTYQEADAALRRRLSESTWGAAAAPWAPSPP